MMSIEVNKLNYNVVDFNISQENSKVSQNGKFGYCLNLTSNLKQLTKTK